MKNSLRKLTITTTIVLMLASCAFSQAKSPSQVHNGYWWKDLSVNFKLGFVTGYAMSMAEVSNITGIRCVVEKNGGTLPDWGPTVKATLEACNNPLWNFGSGTVGQFQEGLDAFYGDFRNEAVDINKAIWYVRDQLQGRPSAELEKELEYIRSIARQQQ